MHKWWHRRVALAGRAGAILEGVNRFLDSWGKGLIVVLLVLLGLVLTVDGVWCFTTGGPLVPPPGS